MNRPKDNIKTLACDLMHVGGGVIIGFGLGAGVVCIINKMIQKKKTPLKTGIVATLSTVGELMSGVAQRI